MTLRNAFDALALDSSIQKLLGGYGVAPNTRKVLDGKFFMAGGAITLGGVLTSSSRSVLQLTNPAPSNKLCMIVGLTVYSTVAQQLEYYEDATMQGTVTAITPINVNRSSTAASDMTAAWSTTAPSGGLKWPNQSRVVADLALQLPPIILPPNKNFTIVGGSGEAHTMTANAYYIEEPLG